MDGWDWRRRTKTPIASPDVSVFGGAAPSGRPTRSRRRRCRLRWRRGSMADASGARVERGLAFPRKRSGDRSALSTEADAESVEKGLMAMSLASAEGHDSVVTNLIAANDAEGTEQGDDRSESSEALSSDTPRRSSSAIERARSANQGSPLKQALRNSAKAILEGGAREGDGPVILQCDLYVKKTGLTNTRYVKHFCTLSYTEGADGRTGCRLSYQESQCIVREITIVGVDDEVAARLEFTIVSDGDQAYSVRAFYRAEFEQWTEAIKKIVAPPLSRQNSEGAAPTRTSSVPSRKSSTAVSSSDC